LVLVLGLALPVGLVAWSHVSREWKTCGEVSFWKKQGNTAFLAGDFGSAGRLYGRALAVDPSSVEITRLVTRARLHDSAWRLDLFQGEVSPELLMDADAVDAAFPSDKATTSALRGFAQTTSGRITEGRELYKKALALDPANGPAHLGLALLYRADDLSLPEAVSEIELVLKARPDNADLLAIASRIMRDAGDQKGAAARLDQALKLKVKPEWLRDMGTFLLVQKDLEGALNKLGESVRMNPRDAAAWDLLAQAQLMTGNLSGGEASARNAVSILAQPNYSFRLAQALNTQKKFGEAVQVLLPMLQKQRDILVVAELAGSLEGMGRRTEAISLYREIVGVKGPDDQRQAQVVSQLQAFAGQRLGALESEISTVPAPTSAKGRTGTR
jgi:tetratricopeptide (TPR) repeat protein